jgi:hypothetical protein
LVPAAGSCAVARCARHVDRTGVAGQVHPHGSALTNRRTDLHVAGRLFDEAVHLRKTKPGALSHLLGGEERFEGLGDHLGRHAGTGIGDHHGDVLSGGNAGVICGSGGGYLAVARSHGQPTAAGHRVARIDRQVEDHVLQLVGVGMDPPQPLGQRGFQAHAAAQRMRQQV